MAKQTLITTKIFLIGLPEDPVETIETFKGTKQELKKRLLELQKGYCQDEKPQVSEWVSEASGKAYMEATSDSDFGYVARIK